MGDTFRNLMCLCVYLLQLLFFFLTPRIFVPRRKSTIDWDAFGLFLDTRLRFLAWLPLKVSNLLLPIDIKACECEPNSRGGKNAL